jgi:hypothetical protein
MATATSRRTITATTVVNLATSQKIANLRTKSCDTLIFSEQYQSRKKTLNTGT